MARTLTPLDAQIMAMQGVVKRGRRKTAAHLGPSLESSMRQKAIEAGARTEVEILDSIRDQRRLQGLKGAAKRWAK